METGISVLGVISIVLLHGVMYFLWRRITVGVKRVEESCEDVVKIEEDLWKDEVFGFSGEVVDLESCDGVRNGSNCNYRFEGILEEGHVVEVCCDCGGRQVFLVSSRDPVDRVYVKKENWEEWLGDKI